MISGDGTGPPGSDAALKALLDSTTYRLVPFDRSALPPNFQIAATANLDSQVATERLKRQFDELVSFTQKLVRESPGQRAQFWSTADTSTPERWKESTKSQRDFIWEEVIGRLPAPSVAANPRSRLIYDEPKFRGYEVTLDVWPDVFAYGILLLPKDLKPGERRPVVVCQHGLEGRPSDVADPKLDAPAYHRYAVRLAEEGFITFAPQNPYIGKDRFRLIQRKAHPLKLALFSFILGQHQRLLEWLAQQPFVDPQRIGFYGLSYGGKTAVRVPPLLDGYALSICSADFNEWVWKNTSVEAGYSYMVTQEYDMIEFNLANVANYAELAMLMAPRPFMVERGHADGVAPDEWVAYEYAKVRRFYATRMKITRSDGNRILRRSPHHQRQRVLRIPAPPPALAVRGSLGLKRAFRQHRAHGMRVGADLRAAIRREPQNRRPGPTPTFYRCSSRMQLSLTISAAAASSTPLPQRFEEDDSGGDGDIQRMDGARSRNRHQKVAGFAHQAAQS